MPEWNSGRGGKGGRKEILRTDHRRPRHQDEGLALESWLIRWRQSSAASGAWGRTGGDGSSVERPQLGAKSQVRVFRGCHLTITYQTPFHRLLMWTRPYLAPPHGREIY